MKICTQKYQKPFVGHKGFEEVQRGPYPNMLGRTMIGLGGRMIEYILFLSTIFEVWIIIIVENSYMHTTDSHSPWNWKVCTYQCLDLGTAVPCTVPASVIFSYHILSVWCHLAKESINRLDYNQSNTNLIESVMSY